MSSREQVFWFRRKSCVLNFCDDESVVWNSWRQPVDAVDGRSAASTVGDAGTSSAASEPELTHRQKRLKRAEVSKQKFRSWAPSEQLVALIELQC